MAEERRAENTGAGSGGLGTRGAARAGVCVCVGGDTRLPDPATLQPNCTYPRGSPCFLLLQPLRPQPPEGGRIKLPQKKIRDSGHQRQLGGKAGTGCQQGRLSQTLSHLGGAGCPGTQEATQEAAAQGHVVFGAGLPRRDLLAPPSFLVCLSSPLRPCGSFVPAEASAAGRELGRQVKKASWKRRDSGGV